MVLKFTVKLWKRIYMTSNYMTCACNCVSKCCVQKKTQFVAIGPFSRAPSHNDDKDYFSKKNNEDPLQFWTSNTKN